MEKKFLSYFDTGSKPESSNFDGTLQNLFTAEFGSLTPVFAKPVLADDHYKIALNSEVKVATLTAPAYTNIKQNFYSFFVPNQIIWKHWNSFISNGTDFQDVYGSNISNQSLDSAWKIPSIPTNYLQLITKIAKGFAIPIISVSASQFENESSFNNSLSGLHNFLHINVDSDLNNNLFEFRTVVLQRLGLQYFAGDTDVLVDSSLFFNLISVYERANTTTTPTTSFDSVLNICPYLSASVVVNGLLVPDKILLHYDGSKVHVYCSRIDFGCSIDDYPELINYLYGRELPLNGVADSGIDYQVRPYTMEQFFRVFADEVNNDFNVNESPFYVENHSVNTFSLSNLTLNATTFRRKYTQNIDSSARGVFSAFQGSLNGYKVINHQLIKLSNFWGKELVECENLTSPYSKFIPLSVYESSNQINVGFYIPDSSAIYDVFKAFFENDLFVPSLYHFMSNPYSHITISRVTSQYINSQFDSLPLCFTPDHYINSLQSTNSGYYPSSNPRIHQFNIDVPLNFYYSNVEKFSQTQNALFTYQYADENGDVVFDYLQGVPLIDSNAIAAGMTTFTLFMYLCQNSTKSLDYFNIPYEGFTLRDFTSYAHELISAMPFMAYSKIWDEYFRNRTVSSPELNFSEVNGIIYFNQPRKDYCTTLFDGDYEYFQELTTNGWVIPFDVLPKNSQDSYVFDSGNGKLIVQGINNFHYFNITCTSDWFNLLTGFQLSDTVLHQVLNSITIATDNNIDNMYVLGAIVNNFQLPNFYNGLLHFRYQNFSKDYFSSALLDAMSGANEELIPQNVSELRSAEARQSFWEQTAVARSLKKFYQKMFGTNPTHIDLCRPLLLGQMHTSVSVGEIIQTSESGDTPQGTRTGIAGSHDVSGICNHGFNEQGWLIILSSFTLDAQYFQGLSKHLTPYKSFLDYPFRQFYHIGNQSINMREVNYFSNPSDYPVINSMFSARFSDLAPINPYSRNSISLNSHRVDNKNTLNIIPNYCINSDSNFNSVFGYIPRFSEYKFNLDECHGDFRGNLDTWNSFRKFHTLPYLTHNFVNWEFSGQNYDLNRLFAVQDNSDKFLCSLFINCEMHRQIPYYTVPKTSVN